MSLRTFLTKSRAGRVVCVVLLVLFVLLCGFHFGGDHHYSDGDALAVIASTILVVALMGVTVFAAPVRRTAAFSAGMSTPLILLRPAPPPKGPTSSEMPLLR